MIFPKGKMVERRLIELVSHQTRLAIQNMLHFSSSERYLIILGIPIFQNKKTKQNKRGRRKIPSTLLHEALSLSTLMITISILIIKCYVYMLRDM
jgi:hypothetical protein